MGTRARRLVWALGFVVAALHAPRAAEAAPSPRLRTAPVSVAGQPRSLVTLVVPVPVALEALDRVHFQVVMSGSVDVVGRLDGVLVPSAGSRSVMLTLRVPATALVGLMDVADVIFTAEDGTSVAVPIILRVPGIYALRVTGLRELAALDRGDRVELEYQVQNLGNDTERLRVDVASPRDWNVRVESGEELVVPPYATATVTLRLRVPPVQSTGMFSVGVRLARLTRADSLPAGSASTILRVSESVQRAEVLAFHPFVGAAASADGAAVATGLRVAGPIVEGVRLDASFTPPPSAAGLSAFGLSSVGLARVPLSASLTAEQWSAQVGVAQSQMPALTGFGIGGLGGSATVRRGAMEYHVFAAEPQSGRGGSGRMLGATAARTTERGRFGVAVSSLEQRLGGFSAADRSLTAIGADWESADLFDRTDLSAALALRQYGAGAGVGLRVGGTHQFPNGRLRYGALFAPGGTAAFAPASRRFDVDFLQQVGEKLSFDIAAQTSLDEGNVFQEYSFSNLSVGGRAEVFGRLDLSLRLGQDRSEASGVIGGTGGFGSLQRYVAAGVSSAVRGWGLSLDTRSAVVERETQLFSGAQDRRRAPQYAMNADASRNVGMLGNVSVGASYVASGVGLGLPDAATTAYLLWNEFPLLVGEQLVRLSQEARVIRTSLLPAQAAFRTSATTTLAGLDLTGSFERTPFLTDRQGRPAWIFGLRVSMSSQWLTSDRLLTAGVVFRDANGNGRRDEGEAGVPGVGLTHDRLRVTTDRKGEYRVPQSSRGRLRVDAASIPSGLVLHPRMYADTVERREIPLTPTGTLTLALTQQLDEDGRVPALDFSKVDAWLRDADGFEWVGRHLGNGEFAFEHAPVGTYSLRTSFARTGQQFRTDERSITLEPGTNGRVEVPVRGRNIRIITPPSQGRGQIGPRNGGAGRNRS